MFDRYAGRLYDYLEKRHRAVRLVLLILVLASLASLFLVRYESSMDDILPRDEAITRTMNFFRNSDVTGKVVVSLGLTGPDKGTGDLLPVVDRTAASLDRSLFPEVQTGLSEADAAEGMEEMLRDIPGMMTRDDLAWIESRISRKHVSEKLRSTYLQLLRPEGMFLGSIVRTDPLGLQGRVLQRMSSLSAATGYDVTVKDGHFVSRDGRHALIIAKSTVPVVDAEGGRRLLASLQGTLAALPDFVSADVVSGHAHTVSNERLIRSDINVIGLSATIGFFLLYVVIIRDLRSVLIFLVPYIATLFAIPLSALVNGSISYWVLGLGSTVAGITIDYGSHVYFSAGGRSDRGRGRVVKQLIKPLSFGAFTTIAVFCAFFASRTAGYGHLAVFSIICILISTFLAIYVLPHFLPREKKGGSAFADRASAALDRRAWSSGTMVALWIVLTGVLSYHAVQVEFERDLRRVDGTSREVLDAEERFHRTWGGRRTPAVLVAAAPEYEQALDLNERIYHDAAPLAGDGRFTSIAPLLPSERTRSGNEERWKAFWSPERRQKLRTLLAEEGRPYGFSEQAFEPFFAGLNAGAGAAGKTAPGLFERFVQKTGEGYQVLSFFPDEPDLIDSLGKVSERHPGAYIVSGTVLSESISRAASFDMKLLSVIAAALVLLVTYAAFWNVRETLIAMVPPVTSLIWLLGIMEIIGMPLNVANMIAGVIVIGLSSDYGIFMSFLHKGEEQTGTIFSITLCTVTTVIGAGALVFAKHPALWSVGVTVVIGVGVGYLTSILVVPKLCEAWLRPAGVRTA